MATGLDGPAEERRAMNVIDAVLWFSIGVLFTMIAMTFIERRR